MLNAVELSPLTRPTFHREASPRSPLSTGPSVSGPPDESVDKSGMPPKVSGIIPFEDSVSHGFISASVGSC